MEELEKINTDRVEGFLNLDSYFRKSLDRDYIDEED